MTNFHVGQHVGMRKDAFAQETPENLKLIARYQGLGFIFPEPGKVYVVRDVVLIPVWPCPALRLDEIRNGLDPHAPFGLESIEPPFPGRWFRPLKAIRIGDFVGKSESVPA